jgi:hypothetical protein
MDWRITDLLVNVDYTRRHLNRPATEECENHIAQAYQSTPAKLQHCPLILLHT